jgi:hypothetical protein
MRRSAAPRVWHCCSSSAGLGEHWGAPTLLLSPIFRILAKLRYWQSRFEPHGRLALVELSQGADMDERAIFRPNRRQHLLDALRRGCTEGFRRSQARWLPEPPPREVELWDRRAVVLRNRQNDRITSDLDQTEAALRAIRQTLQIAGRQDLPISRPDSDNEYEIPRDTSKGGISGAVPP